MFGLLCRFDPLDRIWPSARWSAAGFDSQRADLGSISVPEASAGAPIDLVSTQTGSISAETDRVDALTDRVGTSTDRVDAPTD
jgi:hypothetical protein